MFFESTFVEGNPTPDPDFLRHLVRLDGGGRRTSHARLAGVTDFDTQRTVELDAGYLLVLTRGVTWEQRLARFEYPDLLARRAGRTEVRVVDANGDPRRGPVELAGFGYFRPVALPWDEILVVNETSREEATAHVLSRDLVPVSTLRIPLGLPANGSPQLKVVGTSVGAVVLDEQSQGRVGVRVVICD